MTAKGPMRQVTRWHPGRVAVDLPCHACGYDLRSLDRSGRCPECGLRVSASLKWWFEDEPPWLARVEEGAGLLTASLILLVAIIVGCAITAWGGWGGTALILVALIVGFLDLAAGVLGLQFVTTRYPVRTQERRVFGRLSARRVVRGCMVTTFVALLSLAPAISVPWPASFELLILVPWTALLGAVLLFFPALAFHLTALLRHARATRWEHRARGCAWGITLAEVLIAATIAWNAGALRTLPPPGGALTALPLVLPPLVLVVLVVLTAVVFHHIGLLRLRLEQQQIHTPGAQP